MVNAVICYYAALSRDNKILFQAKADYPDNCAVSAADITVLLGNLLENALEACLRETEGTKLIRLQVKQRGDSELLILTDNTCITPVVFEGGTPVSSKRPGPGIGVSSVREIAARYGGTVRLEQKDGMFYASVLLQIGNRRQTQD